MEERSCGLVHFVGCVGVYLLSELCGGLAKTISDTFYRRPSFDKEGGVGMAEGMGVISFGFQLLPYAVYGVGVSV